MGEYIAFLRGINVGRAKRVAMADLRRLVADLGHLDVKTVLNSGNVVFRAAGSRPSALASGLQDALAGKLGLSAAVIVVTAADLRAVLRDNPFQDATKEPSRFLVAFAPAPSVLRKAAPLLDEDFPNERLVLGDKAAYLFCGNGILDGRLWQAFSKRTEDRTTARNWRTLLKVEAAAAALPR